MSDWGIHILLLPQTSCFDSLFVCFQSTISCVMDSMDSDSVLDNVDLENGGTDQHRVELKREKSRFVKPER